jgi:hypothetical protein
MSDTPRTDAQRVGPDGAVVGVGFARALERENASLRAELDRQRAVVEAAREQVAVRMQVQACRAACRKRRQEWIEENGDDFSYNLDDMPEEHALKVARRKYAAARDRVERLVRALDEVTP